MSGYCKLFSDIVESSIWDEPPATCKVWVTLLALCDPDGYVRGSVGWLAGKARVTLQECETAVRIFTDADPRSRTPDHEGRRIEVMHDGFLVLNYLVFRDRLSNSPTAIATRERVKRHRARYIALRNASSVTSAGPASVDVVASPSLLPEGGCKGGEPPPVKKPYGEFGGVKLADEEHAKLTAKHGAARLSKGIDILDDYMRSKGKRYKDHYATLKETSWVWQRVDEQAGNKKIATGSKLVNTWHDPNPDMTMRKAF